MNPQEYEVLRRLLAQLVQIRGVTKDPEAEALIQEAVAQQPDATYLLTERVLLLGVASTGPGRALPNLELKCCARAATTSVPALREHLAAPSAGSSPPPWHRGSVLPISPPALVMTDFADADDDFV